MAVNNVLQNKMVKQLMETFDLQPPLRTEHSLNVTEFTVENGFIVIHELELLDKNGKHVKTLDPENAGQFIDQFLVTFRIHET